MANGFHKPSMKCYRKNGSDCVDADGHGARVRPSMKCYRKNGSDSDVVQDGRVRDSPSMKCYRKNGSDSTSGKPAPQPAHPQ